MQAELVTFLSFLTFVQCFTPCNSSFFSLLVTFNVEFQATTSPISITLTHWSFPLNFVTVLFPPSSFLQECVPWSKMVLVIQFNALPYPCFKASGPVTNTTLGDVISFNSSSLLKISNMVKYAIGCLGDIAKNHWEGLFHY